MTAPSRYEICHLFLSPLHNESRMFKELATAEKLFPAKALLSIGLQRDEKERPTTLLGRYPCQRIKLWSANLPKSLPFQLIKYVEWIFRAARKARASGASIIHCHSVPALPAAVLAAAFTDRRIIYDAHELESRRAGFSTLRTFLVWALEKGLLTFCDQILTVSPSIYDYYKREFPKKDVSLLMNIPRKASGRQIPLRTKFGIPRDSRITMYVGGFVKGRGIDLLLKAFSNLGNDHHLIFMGEGHLDAEIEKAARERPNIHLSKPVDERDVVPTLSQADLSFSVNDCESLNHQFSLPNKFFQSLMAGVPILVNTQNVDMLLVGKESELVYSVDYDAEEVRKFITVFSGEKIDRIPISFSWESQEEVLLSAYRRLISMRKKKAAD